MLDTIATLNGFAREFNITEVCSVVKIDEFSCDFPFQAESHELLRDGWRDSRGNPVYILESRRSRIIGL